MKSVAINTANHKGIKKKKTETKFRHCEAKMSDELSKKALGEVPPDTWDIARGVNIFCNDLVPEACAEPMVCAEDITLSNDELEFLRKGPRYMMRQNVSENDFVVELEKMVIKDKYDACESGRGTDSMTPEGNDSVASDVDGLSALAEEISVRSGMIYSRKEKVLDMGKMKATSYKFNKYVHLPRPETTIREAVHEIRKNEMLRIFRKTVGDKGKTVRPVG